MLRFSPFICILVLFAGCAKELPTNEGIYIRDGREWIRLPRVPKDKLLSSTSRDLNVLRAPVKIDAADEPKLALVGAQPALVAGFQREGAKWSAFSVAALAEENKPGAWRIQLPQPAPRGLVVLQIDSTRAVAFVNGADATHSFALGEARRDAGQLELAEAAFDDAVNADENLLPAKNALALTLAAQNKDFDRALKLANEAIAGAGADTEKALYYDTLGEVYFADLEVETGMESINRAIQLDLKNPAFHTHLTRLIEKAQKEPPEAVFRRFFDLLARNDYGDAEDLCIEFDVRRLNDSDKLGDTFSQLAKGAPFKAITIQSEMKHGKVTFFKYFIEGQDGSRRIDDIQLQFIKGEWRVGLP